MYEITLKQLCNAILQTKMFIFAIQTVKRVCVQALSTEAAARVKQLWSRFNELLQAPSDRDGASDLSSGQMLLMGFNGLFLQLEADFSAMLEAGTRLRVPDQWMTSVDVLAEASVLQVPTLTLVVSSMYSDIACLTRKYAFMPEWG